MVAQRDILCGCRLQGGDETAVAGHVYDGNFERGQALQGLGGDLDVAENHDLANGRDRHSLDFFAILADDEMLAAFADVGAGFLKVKHGPFVTLR